MIEQTYEPPVSLSWFQRQLSRLTRGTGLHLRIEWTPRLFIAKTVDREGNKRNYAKYPVRFGAFARYHRGNHFYRDLGGGNRLCVGYQKTGELIPPNVLPSDIAVADLEYINRSVEIFVVEQKLPDVEARPMHEEKRRLARENLGFDLFGEFPAEGIWDWRHNISEHRGVMQGGVEVPCCEIADFYGVYCEGVWREPDRRDLELIESSIADWKQRKGKADLTLLIEQRAKDMTAAIEQYEQSYLLEILKEGRELEALDKVAHDRSRLAMGINTPRHRTAY